MRIVNARIFPIDAPPIEDGFVEIEEGKIAAIGSMKEACPAEGELLDAAGGWLFPGFIDAHCHLGMWEDGLGFEGDDGNESTDPATPQLRPWMRSIRWTPVLERRWRQASPRW